jgi:hypothetical protein
MTDLTDLQLIRAVRDHVEAVYRAALDFDNAHGGYSAEVLDPGRALRRFDTPERVRNKERLDREAEASPRKAGGPARKAELDRTIADLTPFIGKRLDDLCRSLTGEAEGEWGVRFLRELSWDQDVGAKQLLGRIRARLDSLRVMPAFLNN